MLQPIATIAMILGFVLCIAAALVLTLGFKQDEPDA